MDWIARQNSFFCCCNPPPPSFWPPISVDHLKKDVSLDRGRCLSVPVSDGKSVNNSVGVVVGGKRLEGDGDGVGE